MTLDEARRLILHEGMSGDAIYLDVRMGNDPGAARMAALLSAIDTMIANHRCGPELDRTITFALWAISLHTHTQSLSWQEQTGQWRDGAFNDEIMEFSMKAEEYLFRDVDFATGKDDKPIIPN